MMNIIDQLSSCLQLPYLVLLLLALFVAVKEKWEKIFIILPLIFLFLSWRTFLNLSSSRYYSSFLVLIVVCLAYILKPLRVKPGAFVLVALGLLVYNAIKLNTGFRNYYIHDLQDDIKHILEVNPQNKVIIYGKEYNRVLQTEYNVDNQIEYDYGTLKNDIEYHYIDRSSFYNSLFFVLPEYSLLKNQDNDAYYNTHIGHDIKKIRNYYTNYKHNKNVSILVHPPLVPKPACTLPDSFDKAILKAWEPQNDVFVYQFGNKLIWLIGTDIDNKTEIIYHIRTSKPNLLPISRLMYRFDNRGFRAGKMEKTKIGKYTLFEKEIPSEYPVTSITVGYNIDGITTWERSFQIQQDDNIHMPAPSALPLK